MSRFGARILLKNYCNPTKQSVVILASKSLYFHPVEIYYNTECNKNVLVNNINIGNVRYHTKQLGKRLVIVYKTETIKIHFSQYPSMRARLEYQEKWQNGQYRKVIVMQNLGIDWEYHGQSRFEQLMISESNKELEWLMMSMPCGFIFNSFGTLLCLLKNIHKTDHFRKKMRKTATRWN